MDNNTNNWKEFTLGDVQEEHPRRVAKRSRKPLLVLLIVAVLAVAADALSTSPAQSSVYIRPLSDRTYTTVPPTS